MSDNGFSDLSSKLKKYNVSSVKILAAQEEAANFFVKKLRPLIPKSEIQKDHMADDLHVFVNDDEIEVTFGGDSFYWLFSEHGTGGEHPQRAQHYVKNALDANKSAVLKILTEKLF